MLLFNLYYLLLFYYYYIEFKSNSNLEDKLSIVFLKKY